MKRKGFTIVELLMVIGVIAVLMGIVTTAASESVKSARARRADAVIKLVQAGLAAYYAQEGDWPVSFQGVTGNHRKSSDEVDSNQYDLTASEVRTCVKKLVEQTKKGTPLIDVSGLWVSRSTGDTSKREYGLDFMSAIHGTRKTSKKMKLDEMYFGYPDTSSGSFRRFGMGYSISTDELTVGYRDSYLGSSGN